MIPIDRESSPTRCALRRRPCPAPLPSPALPAPTGTLAPGRVASSPHAPRAAALTHRGCLLSAQIIAEHHHDPKAFTQGILCKEEEPAAGEEKCARFWESTGLYGETSVRVVDRLTGKVIQKQAAIDRKHFGEGLVEYGEEILMLTWQSNEVRNSGLF